jgi:hypothetical protein
MHTTQGYSAHACGARRVAGSRLDGQGGVRYVWVWRSRVGGQSEERGSHPPKQGAHYT